MEDGQYILAETTTKSRPSAVREREIKKEAQFTAAKEDASPKARRKERYQQPVPTPASLFGVLQGV